MYWAEYTLFDGKDRICSNVSGRFNNDTECLDYIATRLPFGDSASLKINLYKNQVLIRQLVAINKPKEK